MRKMFLLFGMLAMVGILFVACSDQQDLTSPEEAAFGTASLRSIPSLRGVSGGRPALRVVALESL